MTCDGEGHVRPGPRGTVPFTEGPGAGHDAGRAYPGKLYGGSTKAMAAAYGVSQRTVERWIDGTRTPPQLSKAAEKRWQKQNTARAKQGRPPLPRPTTKADQLATDAVHVQTTERGRERKAKQLEQPAPSPATAPASAARRRSRSADRTPSAPATSTSTSAAIRPPPWPWPRTRTRYGPSSARSSPSTSTAAVRRLRTGRLRMGRERLRPALTRSCVTEWNLVTAVGIGASQLRGPLRRPSSRSGRQQRPHTGATRAALRGRRGGR